MQFLALQEKDYFKLFISEKEIPIQTKFMAVPIKCISQIKYQTLFKK